MDVGVLRERISATLDANADIRRQAELDLKYVGQSMLEQLTNHFHLTDALTTGRRAAGLPQRITRHSPGRADQCRQIIECVLRIDICTPRMLILHSGGLSQKSCEQRLDIG